jgi:hypothetical protein
MNDELKRMWKKAVVAYFKEIYLRLPGETEENLLEHQSR